MDQLINNSPPPSWFGDYLVHQRVGSSSMGKSDSKGNKVYNRLSMHRVYCYEICVQGNIVVYL